LDDDLIEALAALSLSKAQYDARTLHLSMKVSDFLCLLAWLFVSLALCRDENGYTIQYNAIQYNAMQCNAMQMLYLNVIMV